MTQSRKGIGERLCSTSLTLMSPLFYLQEGVFWLMDEVARAHGTGEGGNEEAILGSGQQGRHGTFFCQAKETPPLS